MNSYSNPKQYYGLMSGEMGIPEMLVSSGEQMMPPGTTTVKSIPSQSGNATSGGIQLFQIATGAGQGYIKPGSLYLKCRITVTQAGAGAGCGWAFGSRKGASQIINRLNVSCGGVQIHSLNNYNVLHDALLTHASSYSYIANDSVLYEDTGIFHNNNPDAPGNKVVTVCIPVMAPIFNNEQALPLYLFNSPLVLELLYNPVSIAIDSDVVNVTEYTVSEAQLVFEQLSVSAEFEQSVKAKLASGALYQTYLDDYYNLQVASSQTLNYQVGLGLSSIKAVLWTEQLTANQVVANLKQYTPNGITNFRLFLDGRQVNLNTLDTQSSLYAEMQRAIQNLWDFSSTSFNQDTTAQNIGAGYNANTPRGLYAVSNFLGGVNTNRCNDGAFAFTGSPAQNINFILEHSGAPDQSNFPANPNFDPASVTYVMVLYSQKLMIDANGAITLVR